jgi:anti-sigma factor RsiW
MKHPAQATLALHASGDLGLLARWRTERHVAQCDRCREEVAAFDSLREVLPDLTEIPEVPWNRLAAEMKANIRLGLSAGECVRKSVAPLRETPLFTGARAVVAFASIIALMVTGLMIERPMPKMAVDERPMVQATSNGIEVRGQGQALRLMHPDRNDVDVMYSVGAQGSVRARYVDPDSGIVTVNDVYVR